MAMKLGELLLHEHQITAGQLGDALRWQVLYGVRLGRALIEMGYASETSVGEALSRKLGVPVVGRKELLSLPPETIALLSADIAVRHRAIPLGVSGRLLRVAMTDPIDRQVIDVIAQETGAIVQALVSPDLLICIALEKYYNNRCSRHEVPLPGNGNLVADRQPDQEEPGAPVCEVILGSDEEPSATDDETQPEDPFAPQPETVSADGVIELDPFSVQLAGVRSREEVADAVMDLLTPRFQAVALAMLRKSTLTGWRAASNGRIINCCEGASLPLGASPALRTLLKGKPFNGLFLSIPDHAAMIEALHLPTNSWLLAQPISMQKKTVAALLVWGAGEATAAAEDELKGVAAKIAMALQMLILRSKILAA